MPKIKIDKRDYIVMGQERILNKLEKCGFDLTRDITVTEEPMRNVVTISQKEADHENIRKIKKGHS